MPNHIHMIISLHTGFPPDTEATGGRPKVAPTAQTSCDIPAPSPAQAPPPVVGAAYGRPPAPRPTISRIIQQFKGAVTKQIGFALWQKSFHDHIIRDEREYEKIYAYIETNPLKWREDCFYGK